MSRELQDALNECLDALRAGRRTLDDCLALYPQLREELEPLLRVALGVNAAYRQVGAESARQEGRRRLLEAAAAMPPARDRWWSLSSLRWRLTPASGWMRPALMATGLLFMVFVGFSSYAVSSSSGALPGDWRYAVKRFTERTRLALAFDGDTKRSLRIDFAEERLDEIEGLAARSRPIHEPLLRDLVNSTTSVVNNLSAASVPAGDINRISELTSKQRDVLERVQPLVVEQAADDLEAALAVADQGHEIAVRALAEAQEALAPTPQATPSAAAGATAPTATPAASSGAVPGASPTPVAAASPASSGGEATPVGSSPSPDAGGTAEATPVPPSTPVPPPTVVPRREVVPVPDDTTGGLVWQRIVIDYFSVLVPLDDSSDGNGWAVSSPLSREPGEVLKGLVVVVLFEEGETVSVTAIRVADGSVSLLARGGAGLKRIEVAQVNEVFTPATALVVQHVLASIQAPPAP